MKFETMYALVQSSTRIPKKSVWKKKKKKQQLGVGIQEEDRVVQDWKRSRGYSPRIQYQVVDQGVVSKDLLVGASGSGWDTGCWRRRQKSRSLDRNDRLVGVAEMWR